MEAAPIASVAHTSGVETAALAQLEAEPGLLAPKTSSGDAGAVDAADASNPQPETAGSEPVGGAYIRIHATTSSEPRSLHERRDLNEVNHSL
jgi:hypothetical protein